MASKLARRTTVSAPRRGPSPLVAKLKNEVAKARSRARAARSSGGTPLVRDALVVGGAAGFGLAESKAYVPSRLGPVDTALVVGGVGALVVPRVIGGAPARVIHDLTLGALAVAAYKLGGGATFWEESTQGSDWQDVG